MIQRKYFEYFDPIISSDDNQSRSGFTRPGRYHGFDVIGSLSSQPKTDYGVGLYHGDGDTGAVKVTSSTNTQELLGFLVTKQGVCLASLAPDADSGAPLTIPLNSSGQDVWYMLIADYIWVNSPGGSEVSFGIVEWTHGDFDAPNLSGEDDIDTMSETQVLLGYISVASGARDYSKLMYYPLAAPGFAGQELDESTLVRTNKNNYFKGYNSSRPSGNFTYNSGTKTLTLDSPTNVAEIINSTSLGDIINLVWDMPNFGEGVIVFRNISNLNIKATGNIRVTGDIPITPNTAIKVIKVYSEFFVTSIGNNVLKLIDQISLPYYSYGNWVTVGYNAALVPDALKVGNVSGGTSSLSIKVRGDGKSGYVFRVRFQLYAAISGSLTVQVNDGFTPVSLGLGSGEVSPVIVPMMYDGEIAEASVGFPPIVKISDSITLLFPNTNYPIGNYISQEVFVSKPG